MGSRENRKAGKRTQRMRRGRGNEMRIMARLGMLIVAGTLWMQDAAGAQEMQMPKQEHTMRGGMSDIKAEYPRLGGAKKVRLRGKEGGDGGRGGGGKGKGGSIGGGGGNEGGVKWGGGGGGAES